MFGYAEQSKVVTMATIEQLIKTADLVQIMHSSVTFAEMCMRFKKRCVVYHTGSKYRNDHAILNPVFNKFCDVAFTDQCEFIGLGGKNEQYIAMAMNTKNYSFSEYKNNGKLKFAHYPSNPAVKGTDNIIKMLRKTDTTKYDFNYSKTKQSHAIQLKRTSECDVYIELFQPILYGKPYGCYGVSAFEAAAMGRIVITNNVCKDVYPNAYSIQPHFKIANTEQNFIEIVNHLASQSKSYIDELKWGAYNWIQKYHSYEATGKRIKKILSI
jgi:hypothetical protein